MKVWGFILTVIFSQVVAAQSGSSLSGSGATILNFARWRGQQVTEAENRIIRIANKITLLKSSGEGQLSELVRLEAELRVSRQNAEVVKDLGIEDYFNVYLSQFADDAEVIHKAAEGLSKEEVAELLRTFLKGKTNTAAIEAAPSSIIGGMPPKNSQAPQTF